MGEPEAWEVEVTDQFDEWADGLAPDDSDALDEAIEVLARKGPSLRRPLVGEITTSRHKNMKELRRSSGNHDFRILFAFDPRRTAILLLGGDKAGDWNKWYQREVPRADDLYDEYLDELGKEGLLP